ncbi:hypothetical protein PG996_002005 [Apiospora saccharicola]|uniref:BZIP domain-containing protein n=1 Tax=Apiospora saccharicola TaxID=335842 RepID=A0ABR1WM71_9PEZI
MATQPQGNHGDGYDNGDSSRPSFAKFWKRSKAKLGQRRNITFVSANPGALNGEPAGQAPNNTLLHDEGVGKAEARRAQVRRAQVRRAQIQHRQRKANYAKELEMDIVRLRGDIERCKTDCWTLAGENQGMRQQLTAGPRPQLPLDSGHVDHHPVVPGVGYMPIATQPGDDEVPSSLLPQPPQDYGEDAGAAAATAAATWAPLSPFHIEPGYMAHLDVAGSLGSPAFQVTRMTAADQEDSARFAGALGPPGLPFGEDEDGRSLAAKFSGEETDKAINFILALEHVCWSHFKAASFQLPDGGQPSSPLPLASSSCMGDAGTDPCHGHALMVSAMALQQAPDPIFQRLENQAVLAAPVFSPAASSSSSSHGPPPPRADTNNGSSSVAWRTTSLTLESLHDLASTLNLPDLELAPVQAWFEIIREYGSGAVLGDDGRVLEQLTAELRGLVKCLSFGAVIEREAFDSVLYRVLGNRTIGRA